MHSLWNLIWFVPLASGLTALVTWARWTNYKRHREDQRTDAYYRDRGETPPWERR